MNQNKATAIMPVALFALPQFESNILKPLAMNTMMKPLQKLIPAFGLMAMLVLAFVIFQPAESSAQVSGPDKPIAGATPGGTDSGTESDAELWRKVRGGIDAASSSRGTMTGQLMQVEGNDWRLTRTGPLPMYSAWALLGTIMVLSLFFALRGRIKVSHGFSGRLIQRFSSIERMGHWLLASSFILLALTGLNLMFGREVLIPLLGKDAFSTITVAGKFIHNYVAFAFMVGLVMILIMWIKNNIPNKHDVMWFLKGGGIIGNGHPAAEKFNGGQKILFWLVILCGISISVSGWALMNPFTMAMFGGTFEAVNSILGTSFDTNLSTMQEQQYQSIWHSMMAVFMMVVIIAHIYIGTIGMQGAVSAMTSGDVDINWAREHHSLWVDEVETSSQKPDKAPVGHAD
ncbi:MAG: formate dehydrogenase subunit gamma [Rhizobiaceae bacterium]